MQVQPGEIKARAGQHPADRLVRRARGEREAELLVVVRGGHELVRGSLDAGGDADQIRGRPPLRRAVPGAAGRPVQPLDLLERVGDDVPDPGASAPRLRRLLLPCSVISPGGTPARSATSSSPPVQTSTPRPSSVTQRSTA
jgi:hypothetical protein